MRWQALVGGALAFGVVAGISFWTAHAQQTDQIKRALLQRYEVPTAAAHETILGTAEVAAGGVIARHMHHGVEMGFMLEGRMTLVIDGQPDLVLEAGQSYQIPAGVAHSGRNIGSGPAKVVAVYVVEKGKPFAEPR